MGSNPQSHTYKQIAGLPRSLPNAVQSRSKSCISMPIYKWLQHCIHLCKHLLFTTKHGQVLPQVDFLELLMTNADQCRSILTDTNADQCGSMLIIADHCWSLPINTDQCRSMTINDDQCRINSAWDQCQNSDRHWSALIGIGHWSRKSWDCHVIVC